MRTAFDLTPYRRSTVGFDRLFDALENSFRAETQDGYPPFDIVRTGEDSFRITLAVAGFRPDEIDITAQQNQLVISGQKTEKDEEGVEFVHRGIANRAFERRFQLADYVEVRGRIVGGVSGKQVKLISTAYVDGDITAEQLSIDIGAYFQGRVLQGRREAPKAAAPQPAPTPAPAEPAPTVIDMKPAS